MSKEMIDSKTVRIMVIKMGLLVRETILQILEVEDKVEEILEAGKGRGRGRFDKSPNIRRPRVASKTVDKDKMRCHYCNEFEHFIRECSKKNRDENKTGHFNGMSMDYYEDALYTGEDYDDDVFATAKGVRALHPLNS